MNTRALFSRILLTLCLSSVPSLPQAEEADSRERARELFERGTAAALAQDDEGAVEAYQQSYELLPLSGTLLNVGLFQLRLGLRAEAHRTFLLLLERHEAEISEQARVDVARRINELESVLASVRITTRPEGATVLVDESEQGQTPLPAPLLLEPGDHAIEARLDGHDPATTSRELQAGRNPPLELVLTPPFEAPTEPLQTTEPAREPVLVFEPEPSSAQPVESRGSRSRRSFWRGPWPWVIGATIVVGAGAVALGVTLSDRDDQRQPSWTVRVP